MVDFIAGQQGIRAFGVPEYSETDRQEICISTGGQRDELFEAARLIIQNGGITSFVPDSTWDTTGLAESWTSWKRPAL